MDVSSSRGLRGMPFERHPSLVVVVAIGLFAAIFALRLSVHGTQDQITSFYVLPVALVALAFGLRGGALAAATAVLLAVVGVSIRGVSLTPLGWVSRALPLALLGALLGHASDRLRSTTAAEQALFEARLREREAAEISDSIIQELAAAKWSLEAGQSERGLEVLTETIQASQSLVAALLRGEPFRHAQVTSLEPDARTAATVKADTTTSQRHSLRTTRPSVAPTTPTDPGPM